MTTIVIPCYFIDESFVIMTVQCLNGIVATTEAKQIFLVDDGSPHELFLEDDTNFDDDVRILKRKKNGGYAAAVNMGLFHAEGDYIVVCNNDITFPQEDWLKHLLKPLKEGYDISSIKTDNNETEDEITEGDKFGSLWAMKRKVYDTIGGLSQDFGRGYFEDLDYQLRAEKAGFKVAKNHAGYVKHKEKATFSKIDPTDNYYEQAKQKFIEKYGELL